MCRIFGAAAVLLAAAASAAAGPIEWSYAVTAGTPNGAPFLYLGTVSRPTWTPEGGDATETRRAYDAVSPVTLTGTQQGSLEYGTRGNSALGVGEATYPMLDLLAAPPRASDSVWRVTFALTDAASGESGTAEFTWAPRVDDAVFTNGGPGVVGWHGDSQTGTLVLGENRYTVITLAEDRDSWTPLLGVVLVSADTPEPATLLMAGSGLLVPGVGWVRRRSRATPAAGR